MSRKRKENWRLPTILELLTLIDYTKFRPASIDSEVMKPRGYWSSTTYTADLHGAWLVDFYNGCTYNHRKILAHNIRYVRNTKNGLEWSRTMDEEMTWDEAIEYVNDMNKKTL